MFAFTMELFYMQIEHLCLGGEASKMQIWFRILFSCQSIDVGPCKTFWCLQALNQKPFDTVVEVVISQTLVKRATCYVTIQVMQNVQKMHLH